MRQDDFPLMAIFSFVRTKCTGNNNRYDDIGGLTMQTVL